MGARIAVVTGGTSGIGLSCAKAMKNAGCKVYTIARRPSQIEGLNHVSCDVTDEAAVKSAIEGITKKERRIDILVNCAGFGISGAIEFTSVEDAKKQMEVNFFGTVIVTKEVLSHMRENGGGRIVNISSVAAPAAIPFQAFYSASKAAINDYTAALANEVKAFGISATAIMPGDIKTGFTDARKQSALGDDIYKGQISKSVSKMEKDERNGMDPDIAGAYICKIALKKRVKPLYAIGFGYKAICFLLKILPCNLVNWIISLLYM